MPFGRDEAGRRHAARAHAERSRTCGQCGRTIRGNAFWPHCNRHRREHAKLIASPGHVALWGAINAFADAKSIPERETATVTVERALFRLLCWWRDE